MNKIFLIIVLVLFMSINSCFYKKSVAGVISDISLPPVSTFKNSCERCHESDGSAYGTKIGNMGDKALRSEIEEMMSNEGKLNPDSVEIDAMVAFNISLKNNGPFAAAINSKSFLEGKAASLKIEISPDTKLEVNNDNVRIIENGNFRELFYNPAEIKKVGVTVKRNGISSSFDFPDEMWVE